MGNTKPKGIIITGVSGGIGQAIAEECQPLAEDGYVFVLHYRSESKTAQMKELQEEYFEDNSIIVRSDLGQEVESLVQAAKEYCQVTGIVHCAGHDFPRTSRHEMARESTRKLIAINAESAIRLTALCLEDMELNGQGSLIYISSVTASQPLARSEGYALSKATGEGFFRQLMSDAGPSLAALRVNIIRPGLVEGTAMSDQIDSGMQDVMNNSSPTGRATEPEEVGGLVYKLLSSEERDKTFIIEGGIVSEVVTKHIRREDLTDDSTWNELE